MVALEVVLVVYGLSDLPQAFYLLDLQELRGGDQFGWWLAIVIKC